ncbi:C-C motif chemokine 20a.3 [Sardina pilchardus]|uniref:C-C motif chemokine 20a.3 n=1 Tax=Sardina pilchardus TaxID=27697 RepID=UPI002E0DDC61
MAQICVPVLVLIVLCTLGLYSSEAAAVRSRGCCTMYYRGKVPTKQIRGFTIQTNQGKCNINAVILHTPKRNFCVDPELRWVTDAIDKLRAQVHVLRAKDDSSQ